MFTQLRFVLMAVLLLLPVTVSAQVPPIPLLDQWVQLMTLYGQQHCQTIQNGQQLADTYYDSERVFYQVADYTKNSSWLACAQAAEHVYRDLYIFQTQPNGGEPGYWVFPHGLWKDFKRTGDATSKNAVMLLSQNAAYANASTVSNTGVVSTTFSREVAYALQTKILARDLGATNLDAAINWFANTALGHLNQWFVSKTADYMQPFMVGLTCEALIMYYNVSGDSRVLPAIATAMDGLWNGTLADGTGRPLWDSTSQSFYYINSSVSSEGGTAAIHPAPDLNLLIAPAFAWLYYQTGDSKWQIRGDQIFTGGVMGANFSGSKQYNQVYRWSFDYVVYRQKAGTTFVSFNSTPPPPVTSPPASGGTTGSSGGTTPPPSGGSSNGSSSGSIVSPDTPAPSQPVNPRSRRWYE